MKTDAHGKASLILKPLARALMNLRGTSAGFGLLALPAMALAQMPTGGQVVGGSATITQPDANNMVINQGSNKAIINWQGFSIGANGYVQFVQPGSTSIALNRVVGMDPSAILGRLSANGQVFLVNPNGVYFGANATVDVAGIVASTMNIRNEDFMRGDYIFKRDPNAPANATVINAGSINANGGYVVLAGDYVSNTGLIQANLGTAMLASGSALTLQMAGSSLINYAIDEATLAHLAGVNNAGQIMASGGKIIMTAEVANQLAGTVVNNSGLIQAQGTVEKEGAIYLTGSGGDVVNAGTLDASGGQDGKAGQVHMRASGDLVHEAGSLITVDGAKAGAGDAGSVDTWADGKNRFKEGATISGRGGEEGGDGGFVELSGNSVAYRGDIDLQASKGDMGTVLIDPKTITIKSGGGEDIPDQDDATFYEQNLENALGGANVVLLAQDSGEGNIASIHMEDLEDGVLQAGGNGSLTLKVEATNGATGSITFEDKNDQIHAIGQLNLSVENAEGTGVGSIDVGHLSSGTGIDLKAGSISAGSLDVSRNYYVESDSSNAIKAHADSGDLKIAGDVRLDIYKFAVGGVATEVDLQAAGKIDIGGKVISNATGLGYYHYNWMTDNGTVAGANATDAAYFGGQPWKKTGEGDHAISTKLNIAAGGDVSIGGEVQAIATDNNTSFASAQNAAGYWQTATATTHNFWRPTAASAQASITAGGDVNIGGVTTVKADGYAMEAYSEVETYRTMVQNYNYTTAQQKVWTNYGCLSESDGQCTGGSGYRDFHFETIDQLKGSEKTGSEKYIWNFGPYRNTPAAEAFGSAAVPAAINNDFSSDTVAGPMGYSGARGLTSKLDINAGKSVTLNGVEVRAVNRSATGSSSYVDGNWGHQDTAAGLNSSNSTQTSASPERDYSDTISTSYRSASTDAQATVSAGEDSAINLNGATNVVASHTHSSESSGKLDFAKLTVNAGSGSGAQDSAININAPVLVEGSSDRSIDLSVRNRDGALVQAGVGSIVVKNNYASGDASATLVSERAATDLDSTVTVTAGRSATLTAKGTTLDAANTLSSAGTTSALLDLESTEDELNAEGAIQATGGNAEIKLKSATVLSTSAGVTASATNGTSGAAKVGMNAGSNLVTDGAVHATTSGRSGSATVALNAAGDVTNHAAVSASATAASGAAATTVGMTAGTTLNVNATVTASATHFQYDGFGPNYSISGGDATVNLKSGGELNLNADVAANAFRTAAVSVESEQDLIALAAGKTVSSTASGNQIAPNYTYSYAATLNMSSHGAMTLDGSVSTSAVNGSASTNLTTLGGASAGVMQGVDSSISTTGRTATQRIKAGNTEGEADNMAGVNLSGTNSVLASQGDATFQVQGSDISIKNFNVGATAGKSQASISALNGNARLKGSGVVSGSSNTADGAKLAVDATAMLDTEGTSLTVSNSHTGNAAGAIANFTGGSAEDDYNAVGNLSVTASAAATAMINASGDLNLTGTVSANATGSNGVARASVSSTQASVKVEDGAALSVQALGTAGSATTTVKGNSGAVISGDLLAKGAGQATVTVNTTGGDSAEINQSAASEIRAEGSAATINVNAGNAYPDSGNAANAKLGGSLAAAASNGAGTIIIQGSSVELQNVAASSTSGAAELSASALNGTLTVGEESSISVNGNVADANGAVLALDASGAMDLAYATLSVNNASNGTQSGAGANFTAGEALSLGATSVTAGQAASIYAGSNGDLHVLGNLESATRGTLGDATVTLNAFDGNLAVGGGSLVKSSGDHSATTTLQAASGMQIDGDLSALSTDGTALVSVLTAGGATAGINQDGDSTIQADGMNATVRVAAGSEDLDQTNAAWLSLGGTTRAHASNGQASIEIGSASAEIRNLQANADAGKAAVRLATVGEGGSLTLNGALQAEGNADSDEGALVDLRASGALDTTAGIISVSNLSTGEDAKATLGIGSVQESNLGEVTVAGRNVEMAVASQADLTTHGSVHLSGTDSAGLTLQAAGNLGLQSDLEVTATSGMAAATLTSQAPAYGRPDDDSHVGTTGGNVVQDSGSRVLVDGVDSGIMIGAENGTVTLAGTVVAHASEGEAAMDLRAASVTIDGSLQANADLGDAVVHVNTVDPAGNLTVNGYISLTGNSDNPEGVSLTMDATGALDSSVGTISLTNNSLDENGGAVAILDGAGSISLGDFSVSGPGSAHVAVTSDGQLTVTGDIYSSASAENGTSMVSLYSANSDVNLNSGSAITSNGGADGMVSITGRTGMHVDGDIIAGGSTGTASVSLVTTGGPTATINQGGGSTISAEGGNAELLIHAGAEDPETGQGAALDLDGTIVAHASEGQASINLQAGSLYIDGSVQASADQAGATVYAKTVDPAGDLNVNGGLALTGNSNNAEGVSLTMEASGALDTAIGTISLTNNSLDEEGGAALRLEAAGAIGLGEISVSGPGTAIVAASSDGQLVVAGDISSTAHAETGTSMISLNSANSLVGLQAGTELTANGGTDGIVNITAKSGVETYGDISAGGDNGTAVVSLVSSGGKTAAITQGKTGTISAEGVNAEIRIRAGAEEPDTDDSAAINLAGSNTAHATDGQALIDIQGAAATINNLQARADVGTAGIGVTALDEAGTLTLKGNVELSANIDNSEGARLNLQGAGGIDTRAAIITVSNTNTDYQSGASINAVSLGGDMSLGQINISGPQAWMDAYAQQDLVFQGDVAINGVDGVALNATAGRHVKQKSDVGLEATEGLAEARLVAGAGNITLMDTDGDDAPAAVGDVVQDAGRSLTVRGVEGGALFSAENGRVELGGSTVVAMAENAGLLIGAQHVEVNNFSVDASAGAAGAMMLAGSGDLTVRGTGSVTGKANSSEGAVLTMDSQGSIDTRSADISVGNGSSGHQAGARLSMVAVAGGIQAGALNATTNGGGEAQVAMQARGALGLTGDISAVATGSGTAAVRLASGMEAEMDSGFMSMMSPEPVVLSGSITQSAGKLIKAISDSGDAKVEMQTGNCCSGTVALAGAVESKVESGEGTASIEIRSDDVTLNQLTANSGDENSSGADIKVIASKSITVNGKLDLQARNAGASASMALVADALNWNSGAATLSDNNVKIQLAAFDPNRIIGVESDQDFDAVPRTNYSQTMLRNFMGHGAQISFGAEVDRSAFNHSQLSELVQQAADIHVAGNGKLDLGDVRMVFDTTGTVYYHDPRMSPWSVPAGRIAIYVARPNVDRYLDRTDNTLQNMTRALENSVFGNNGTPTVNAGGPGPVPGTTHVSGNLYMAGNGVNTGIDAGVPGNAGNAGDAGNAGSSKPDSAAPGNADPTKREAGEQPQGAQRATDDEDQAKAS